MLSVQTNLQAMNAANIYGRTHTSSAKKTEKLSSGYKINRGADDAAGLAISEKMRRQIRGLTQASANAQDGISMVQIADGAMSEIHDMLHRMDELSIKAANETNTADDREYIQAEIEQLKKEVGAISHKTTFNEQPLLLGPPITIDRGVNYTGGLPNWVSYPSTGSLSQSYTTQDAYTDNSTIPATHDTVAVSHEAAFLDFSSFTGSPSQIDALIGNGFYTTCCTCDSHYSVEFTSGTDSSISYSGNHIIYNVGIDGTQTGEELLDRVLAVTTETPNNHYTKFTKNPDNPNELIIYDERPNNYLFQDSLPAGATLDNSYTDYAATAWGGYGKFGPGVARSEIESTPGNVKNLLVGTNAADQEIIKIVLPNMRIENLNIANIDVRTPQGSANAIDLLKRASSFVSGERSRMGTYQNRLEHTISNLNNQVENTQSAESTIRDTDMATEMVAYSVDQILLQAGQAMLAQANQSSQGILSLLQ